MDIDFEKLIRLQQLDEEIRQITLFLEKTPPLIEEIDKKIEDSSRLAAVAKERMTGSQKKRRELEAEVRDLKSHIGKYKRQLNEVKTNKEYTSLLKEIEDNEKKVDRLEEDFIAEMLREDDIQKDIKEANQKFAEAQQKFSQDKAVIFQKMKEMEEKVKALEQQKKDLLPTIPAEQVNQYLKIFRKKGGAALSPVKDDFCSMCHMRIRPQVINELLATPKLILCENCGRILYCRDEKAEVEAEAKAD